MGYEYLDTHNPHADFERLSITFPKMGLNSWFPVLLGSALLIVLLVYRLALPKPIPGIPYNVSAARSILGDIPAMASHIKHTKGNSFVTYLSATTANLGSPLVQLFVRPLAGNPPMLVLADARESQDVLLRRGRQFDRSPSMGDLAWGIAPGHHIHLRTEDPGFKAQRRLVQDLMTPSFLHGVAGPVIHASTRVMVDLWRAKCRVACGRPFEAEHDLSNVVMDAITAFAFGEAFRARHSTTQSALDAVLRAKHDGKGFGGKLGEPVHFPAGTVDQVCQAILDLTYTVGDLQGNPLPKLTWAYVMRKPRISKAWKIKETSIRGELSSAVERMQASEEVGCAVDHLVLREKGLAEKQGRKPDYLSRIMIDEIFGFVFAGHETTSTTLGWGVKFLADHAAVQTRLRQALRSAFGPSGPTFEAISSTRVPYLDAVLEEIVRCGATAPVVDRIALADTEILGHPVPKGTVVTFLTNGPTMGSPGFTIEEARRSPTSRDKSGAPKDKSWDPNDIGVFKPERWLVPKGPLGDKGEPQEVDFDGAAGPQLGFGLGTRGCFGLRLAKLQMKIVLALLIWNFECLPCPPQLSSYEPELIGVNKPSQCYVTLREIEAS